MPLHYGFVSIRSLIGLENLQVAEMGWGCKEKLHIFYHDPLIPMLVLLCLCDSFRSSLGIEVKSGYFDTTGVL